MPAKGVKEARAIFNKAGIASGGKKLVEANVMDKLNAPVEEVRPHFTKQTVKIDNAMHDVRYVKDAYAYIELVVKMRGVKMSDCLFRLTSDGVEEA